MREKNRRKAKGRVLQRRERGDGWEAGSYRDDDALSWNNQFSRTLQLVLTNDGCVCVCVCVFPE